MAYTTRNAARAANGPKPIDGRPYPSQAGARHVCPSGLCVDFETFASTLRYALMPASPLEAILADRLILAAWRLQLASAVEFNSALGGDELLPPSREALDAESRVEKALELLETSRADRLGRAYRPASEPSDHLALGRDFDDMDDTASLSHPDDSNEWTAFPDDAADADESDDLDDPEIAQRWQDRLVFDFNVSETSPVVKGTWVTVSHVVSLIVDGWTWSDVLRTHPELTEDDVRTCLSYTVEQDNNGGC